MKTKLKSGLKKLSRKEQLKIAAGNASAIEDPVYGNGGGGTNNGGGSGNIAAVECWIEIDRCVWKNKCTNEYSQTCFRPSTELLGSE
ncbi:hypothetical protein [Chryseobacterium tongliaoense]|uniref:hypothetical protein n=1 Tax=Chryseobacterium tongliaoense TaxID=3240933 RepID=UPI0035183FCE